MYRVSKGSRLVFIFPSPEHPSTQSKYDDFTNSAYHSVDALVVEGEWVDCGTRLWPSRAEGQRLDGVAHDVGEGQVVGLQVLPATDGQGGRPEEKVRATVRMWHFLQLIFRSTLK